MIFFRSFSGLRLIVGWLTMLIMGTELFVFSPLLPMLAADFEVSTATAGLSVTAFSLSYMLGAPLLGRLGDDIGRRQVMIGSLLAFAAANLLTALATTLPAVLAVRLFAGAAASGVGPSLYALIGGAAPPGRHATWMALITSGLLVSLALGASTGAAAAGLFGWRSVFIALAALSLLLCWLNRQIWPDADGTPGSTRALVAGRAATGGLLRRMIPTVLWSTGLYTVYTYLGAGLAEAGLSSGRAAEAIVFYGCGAIAGILIGGRVADKAGCKLVASLSFAGLCGCLLLLRLAFDSGELIGPALALTSAAAQLFFPAQQAGLIKDFPPRRAAALAWNNSALFCGISLGSLVGGTVLTLGGFDAALAVAAAIALIGCLANAAVVPGTAALPFAGRAGTPDDGSLTLL